jgi:hypothetical protein
MSIDPNEAYAPEPTVLERKAASLLGRYAGPRTGKEGHDDRRRRLRSVTRRAVALAIVAGIVSGGLIGGSEIWVREAYGLVDRDFWDALPFWIAWFAVAGVVSAVEIAFLYWVAIRGIGRVVTSARVILGDDGYKGLFAMGFARGALEFPNPKGEIWGIDPYAYVPKWRLFARNVAYKMKVGVTSFILRVFLRRVATRLAIRGLVPLMAGPLYAAWNAFIIWRIMIEARLRAFGPPAIDALLDRCFERGRLGEAAGATALHGIGEIIRRAGDMHPNYVYLVAQLRERSGIEIEGVRVDWDRQKGQLRDLPDEDQSAVLRLLVLTALLGSRTYRSQRAVVYESLALVNRSREKAAFKALRQALVDGRLEVTRDLDRAITR